MAVEFCTTAGETIQDNGIVDSESFIEITIPADCTPGNNGAIIVIAGGNYDDGSLTTWTSLAELNFDGDDDVIDFTAIVVEQGGGTNYSIGAWRMVASDGNFPGVGAQTLYYRFSDGDGTEGITLRVLYLKNVDQSSPIISTDSATGSSNWAASLSGTISADDMAIIAGSEGNSSQGLQADYGDGQSIDVETAYNNIDFAVGYELGENAPSIDTDNGNYCSALAFAVKGAAGGSAALTGTAVDGGVLESEIVTGGETIIITLTDDTWIAAGTGPIGTTANTQALIDGIDGDVVGGTGWDAKVKSTLVPADDVVRTSDTVCTVTLNAAADYAISSDETITVTIPAEVLTGGGEIVADSTFVVTNEGAGLSIPVAMYHYMNH